MKAASSALVSHLAGQVLTLATCWRVARRDGVVRCWTDHDRDLTVAGETYLARPGYARTAVASELGLAVGDTEISGILDAAGITATEVNAGVWDYAAMRIFLVNWAAPAAGSIKLRRGWFGEVRKDDRGQFTAELRGLAQALQQRVGEIYSPDCRADLGDARCRVPLEPATVARSTSYALGAYVRVPLGEAGTRADDGGVIWQCSVAGTTAASAPEYEATVGLVVEDGTAEFTALEAWTVYGEAAEGGDGHSGLVVADGFLAQERHASAEFFNAGVLTFEGGANAGESREILEWDPVGGVLTFFEGFGLPIVPGDAFRIGPGCDKQADTCRGAFGNFVNFRGEPEIPGQDALMQRGLVA